MGEHQLKKRNMDVALSQVQRLEASMHALPEELKIDIDSLTKHYFANGVYVREVNVPAGVTIVGKLHKDECINILTKGKIAVTMADGEVKELEAPFTFVSAPNTKKAAYCITDVQWLNVHPNPTETTDLLQLEHQLIEPEFLQLQEPLKVLD